MVFSIYVVSTIYIDSLLFAIDQHKQCVHIFKQASHIYHEHTTAIFISWCHAISSNFLPELVVTWPEEAITDYNNQLLR